jgi:hypothetical protein
LGLKRVSGEINVWLKMMVISRYYGRGAVMDNALFQGVTRIDRTTHGCGSMTHSGHRKAACNLDNFPDSGTCSLWDDGDDRN